MKTASLIFLWIVLWGTVIFFCCHGHNLKPNHWSKTVINDMIPMGDYWRKITGYDSIQITVNYEGDKLHANFCYPNKWQYDKFKIVDNGSDSIYIDLPLEPTQPIEK